MPQEYLSGRCGYFRKVLDGSNLLLEGNKGILGDGWFTGTAEAADGILATAIWATIKG
ncbi:unnamed protein product [marine sediment metagenome]|uniref:Uncharacterized protein n=1 Tax=marine sediment metagenome TaxID=412755 RepID=X1KQK3_9ZZZZ